MVRCSGLLHILDHCGSAQRLQKTAKRFSGESILNFVQLNFVVFLI